MASCLFILAYFLYLWLPGHLLTGILGLRRGRFPLSIALSYALFLLNVIPMEWLRAPLWIFFTAHALQVAVLLLIHAVAAARRKNRRPIPPLPWRPWLARASAPILLASGLALYLVWAGPYTELPADSWHHIERSLYAWNACILSGHLLPLSHSGYLSLPALLTQPGLHWYILHALLCKASGLAISDSLLPRTLVNVIVFCLSIYAFALFLWSRLRMPRAQKTWAALWAAVFTVLWLGISVFAYIRYYAFAPTILNYIVYLAVVILVLDYLQNRFWLDHALWIVPLLFPVMIVTHLQEVVFAVVMCTAILLLLEIHWIVSWLCRPLSGRRVPPLARNPAKIHIFFIGAAAGFVLLLLDSVLNRPMGWYNESMLIPIFQCGSLTAYIQPPDTHFFLVVAPWGLFVYALFLLAAKQFLLQPFILAGMALPLLTVFNPLTLAIFTRWVPDINAIYRLNYMIPLPFAAGFLALCFSRHIGGQVEAARIGGLKAIRWPRLMGPAAALVGLIVLLMPFEPLFGWTSNSRFYSLKPLPEGNDQRHWSDLVAMAKQHPNVAFLTDSQTFYPLYCLNIRARDGDALIRPGEPGTDRLALLRQLEPEFDWWLVVNRRNGDFSMTGHFSGHWPGDIMQRFSSSYPEDFLRFVEEHPKLFKEVWQADGIRVYDILETVLWKRTLGGSHD